jgi:hypothetical protein
MVADAVSIEPVSRPKFPDMRDSAGNFCNLQGSGLEAHRKTPRDQAVMIEIPYATKQGIFRGGSGILACTGT